MAELLVSLSNYRTGVYVRVDLDDDGNVDLRLDAEEPDSDPYEMRVLTADEARALAAALRHFADEAER